MIEVKAKKRFGNFLLDAELKDEDFICLAGKNGSGKSTLLNIIAGIYKLDEGYVKINSESITNIDAEKKQIVLVTPDSCLPNFKIDNHLLWGAKIRKKRVEENTLSQVKKDFGINFQGKVSKLSLGMRERVSLATALLASPKVILVDEAFANIDNKTDFISIYHEYARKFVIDVIFSTQQSDDSKSADHLYQMDLGRVTRLF
jgi:molybdate/tungstate transport system ATP-binding protein